MSKNTTFQLNTTGSGSLVTLQNGSEIYTGTGSSTSQYNRIVTIGDYIISASRDASNQHVTTTQKKDSATGAYRVVPNIVAWNNGFVSTISISVNSTKTRLYTMEVTGNNSAPWTFTLREYDNTLTLLNTYTSTPTVPGFIYRQESLPFFVRGNKVVVGAQFHTTFPGTYFFTEFTILGASLITPIATNLAIAQQFYMLDDGINIYMQTGASLDPQTVQSYTYTSPNFSAPSSGSFAGGNPAILKHNFPNVSSLYQGMEYVSPSVIGIYSNIPSVGNSGNNQIYKTQYLEYTF